MTALSAVMNPKPKTAPQEPLRYARAYSLEIDENGNGTDGFYPLGVLGDRFETGFNVFLGGNYVAQAVSPDSDFPAGTQGVYGVSIQACRQAWLDKSLPKALGPDGKPLKRRPVNLFDPASLESIFAFARGAVSNAVAKGDARIFKWEIDNEFIPELDFSPQAVERFRRWLPGHYGNDLAKFRRVWGEKVDFASTVGIDPDHCTERPGPFMDWIRFQQETFAQFLADYCRAISEADPRHRPVNGKDTQSSLEMLRLARARRANHELIGEAIRPFTQGVRGMDHYGHGDRNAYEMNFYSKTATDPVWLPGRRQGILYGENNNHNGPGWQWAQTLWRMPANGLKGGNLFCSGWFGCWGDWASFGFVNPDGTKREKFWYLPRFFATIHRAERFFTTSAPARDTPKLAMLLAQRDIPFGVDDNLTPWGFPVNSRLRVYAHLRDAGYNVDVIPYSHLAPDRLSQYEGLFLVGAERLSDADVDNIRAYVKGGGTLFCDRRTGQFDEFNLVRTTNDLSDVLGLRFQGVWESGDAVVDPGDVWFSTKYGRLVRGDGRVRYEPTTARVWNDRDAFAYDNKAAVFCVNSFGRGKACWTNTQMGTLRSESSDGEAPARDFFCTLLASAGLSPSYSAEPENGGNLRVETPLVDGRGNAVILLSARTWKPLEPMKLKVGGGGEGRWRWAFLSLAEENRLYRVNAARRGEYVTFDLPAIRSGAAIYLMADHPPLLGTGFDWAGPTVAPGEVTPLVKPGETVKVVVQVANPSDSTLRAQPSTVLKLNALTGWTVREVRPLGDVPAGAIGEAVFEVGVPAEGDELRPNHVQPLTVDLFVEGRRVAVTHTVVQVDVDKRNRELLLSDNWVSADCLWSVWNGAEYRYLTQPNAEKGEAIDDRLWTTRANGQKVFALQSGDRADRLRYATYKNLPKVELEWDLKRSFDLTRLLFRRGKNGEKFDPVSVTCSFSVDGVSFDSSLTVPFACDEKGFCLVTLDPRRARYVRFSFDFGKRKRGQLDEIWLFGRL